MSDDHSSAALPIRVLVVDNDLLIAEAIVLALTQMTFSARFVVPLTVEHLRDVVSWSPGLALLDIDSVDPATCLACVEILRDSDIPVAVMGGRLDVALLGECLNMGATSVVDKGCQLSEVVEMMARMVAGEAVIAAGARSDLLGASQMEVRARRRRLAPFGILTQREKCVLSELMEGYRAEAIAARASVSISTVRSQIKAILQKLGVNSQLAAVALARRAGWTLDVSAEATAPTPLPSAVA